MYRIVKISTASIRWSWNATQRVFLAVFVLHLAFVFIHSGVVLSDGILSTPLDEDTPFEAGGPSEPASPSEFTEPDPPLLLDRPALVRLAGDVEIVYARLFGKKYDEHYRNVEVIEHRDRDSLQAERSGKCNPAFPISGLCEQRTGRIHLLTRGPNREIRMASLVHELVHYFNQCYFGDIPYWIDEGLATFFSTHFPELSGTRPRLETGFEYYRKRMKKLLNKDRHVSLPDLLGIIEYSDWHGDGVGRIRAKYASSWGVMNYLHASLGPAAFHRIETFLDFSRGNGLSESERFRRSFGVDPELFEVEMMAYYFGEGD